MQKIKRTKIEIKQVFGDRLSPECALYRQVEGEFFSISRKYNETNTISFINGRIFSALQCWLQGQENLNHWLEWNRRQFWLDDYVDFIFSALCHELPIDFSDFERMELNSQTFICFRHDNDASSDPSFSKLENDLNIKATYAILDDERLPDWTKIKGQYPQHEYSLHYTTIDRKFKFGKYIDFFISLTPFRSLLNKYAYGKDILSKGKLLKQVSRARKNDINGTTISRHFAYMPYPEIIDELEAVYNSEMGIIASQSFFRGHIYRYGDTILDGIRSTLGLFPDSQHPYWMPFRLAHAAYKGKILNGWESSMIMEAEPEFFNQILSVTHKNLPYKFITFCFHPAGAYESPMNREGTLEWLRKCIVNAKDGGIPIWRYDHFIEMLNAKLKNDA